MACIPARCGGGGASNPQPSGQVERLTKRDPSLLALCSRRFLPRRLKPQWLLRLDARFTMDNHDLQSIFEVPYLSDGCLLVRSDAYTAVGGFDSAYFLYLEDADLTRRLPPPLGRCLHLLVVSVTHGWGLGSHRRIWLTLVNFCSAFIYFPAGVSDRGVDGASTALIANFAPASAAA